MLALFKMNSGALLESKQSATGSTVNSSQSNQNLPLWLAAKNGKEDEVESQLSTNEWKELRLGTNEWNKTAKDSEGRTALWWAVWHGQARIAGMLLATRKFDVNERPYGYYGLLHAAVLFKHIDVTKLLLDQDGLDVNSKDTYGLDNLNQQTPLHLAADRGLEEMAKLLLAHPGIDVNSQNKSGETPLHAAAKKGYKEILVLLLARAEITLAPRNKNGSAPLHLAAENGHEELVDALLGTPKLETMSDVGKDEYGGSPLHAAAKNGHRGVVKLLLAHGTDPDLRDPRGATPLHLAAIDGYEDCVIALMDRADVNVKDQNLRTPLHEAVQEQHHKVVEHLLKKSRVLVHVPDKDLSTPLHLALLMGYESIARQLLKASGFGETPKGTHNRALLSCATQTGNAVMLKLLFKRLEPSVITAEINALDENEQTLLWSAAKRRDNNVMELLSKKDEVTLHLLVQRGEASLVTVLLEAGYNVDTKDNLGRSALHVATILGHFDIAESLVSFGASVDCKDGRGNTALRLAIQRKRCDFINMLLESSADMTGVRKHEWLDAYGQTMPDAVYLEKELSGKKTIRSIKAAAIPDTIRQMHNAPKTGRRLMLLANELPWKNGQLHPSIVPIRPNMLETSVPSLSKSGNVRFSVAIWFPAGFDKANGNFFKVPDRGTCRIAWSTSSSTSNVDDELRCRPTDYFSMLPSGNIPKDGLDFFAQFLSHLREVWLEICDLAEQHLAECRISQLEERGSNRELILRLAQNARTWADLRKILKEQTRTAHEFASDYSFRYNGNQGSDEVDMLLSDFTTTIGGRLDGLDQTVRDLLQLVDQYCYKHETPELDNGMRSSLL
ncbi:hypothetical protein J4E82_002949 [Alternaria postmessia]|uniref:uncharacterized protein n=1 Tax=Alternaria postmessia TaxID=1187938 RepID=UPI0022247D25|nr:uncharacterized protein J4E82_002949 [Alternaria postmessia]KAI5378255.1 hypothetical protein J4E82_002949 [Alternaria postmessia]